MANNVQIDISKTEAVQCKCGNETFDKITFLRRLPGILSPTFKDELIPLPGFICRKCKNLFQFSQKEPPKIQ